MSVLQFIGITLVLGIGYLYFNFKQRYRLFKNIGVPYIEPTFPLGNIQDSVFKQKHFAFITQDLYNKLKAGGHHFGGVFLFKAATLIVVDPEFVKTILVRDFVHFVDRGVFYNKRDDPLSANLFFLEGDEWRRLRNVISPTFTSGKMKQMYHTISAVGDGLVGLMQELVRAGGAGDSIDMREYLARFTTDVIGSCGFGMECDSIRNSQSEFREMGKKMFNVTKIQSLKVFIAMLLPKQARALGVQFNSNEVIEFVTQMVKKTITYRLENNIRRNDFMQSMINLHKDGSDGLTLAEISAQSFLFFFAGFETTSTTLSYALYELANNQEIQDRLRLEILAEINGKDQLSYEQIMKMEYLDMVLCETLRKYPTVATLHRIANNDYTLPNGAILPKGTFIIIPTYALHHDSELFPFPDTFDPERFSKDVKTSRHTYAYLPFGEGPRNCVGLRFGMMQAKIGLAMLLSNFIFRISSKTEIPLKFNQVNLMLTPQNGLWLNVEAVKKRN